MAMCMHILLFTLCMQFGTSFQQRSKLVKQLRALDLMSEPSTCPDGWSKFRDTCYMRVEDTVTWDDANTRCADHGAILAEPDTWEKLQFLTQTLGGWGWIGLTYDQTQGTYLWRGSGRPVVPRPWYGDEEWCFLLNTNGWYNFPCTALRTYFCEKQASIY